MELRRATAGDADAIRGVARRSVRATFALQPRLRRALLDDRFGKDLHAVLTDPGRVVLVAEIGAEVVGVAAGRLDRAVVEWLHVAPAHRDVGVGDALYERLRGELGEPAESSIRPRAWERDATANSFWRRRGFTVVNRSFRVLDEERFVECEFAPSDGDDRG